MYNDVDTTAILLKFENGALALIDNNRAALREMSLRGASPAVDLTPSGGHKDKREI
jgi:hypothetical protein